MSLLHLQATISQTLATLKILAHDTLLTWCYLYCKTKKKSFVQLLSSSQEFKIDERPVCWLPGDIKTD